MSRLILNLPPAYNALTYQGSISKPWLKWMTQSQQAHTQFFPIINLVNGATQVPIPSMPSYTTTEIADLQNPTNGMMVYNTTTHAFNFYENGVWVTKS